MNTVRAYQIDLIQFFRTCSCVTLKDFSSDKMNRFIRYLKNSNKSSSTIRRKIYALKCFLQFLEKRKRKSIRFLDDIIIPKREIFLPVILTQDEINRFLATITSQKWIGFRDRAMFEVLYSTGIRVSELCNLTGSSLWDGTLRIFGKGAKERIVPLTTRALSLIYKLYDFCGTPSAIDPIFRSQRHTKMDRVAVFYRTQIYAKKANLGKKISVHAFRHTFATHMLEKGAELVSIQKILGHSSLQATEKYLHVSIPFLKTSLAKYHPRY